MSDINALEAKLKTRNIEQIIRLVEIDENIKTQDLFNKKAEDISPRLSDCFKHFIHTNNITD